MTTVTTTTTKPILTSQNYYSDAANWAYMSNSQYKGFLECEAKQMAKLRGEWTDDDAIAFLQGKYVHAWNEGVLDEFIEQNKESIFKKDKQKKLTNNKYAEFVKCDEIIERIKRDQLFMMALSGKKEVIFSAEMFGIPWKILIDSYFPENRRFGDLKILKSLYDKFWLPALSCYENVFQYRGYFTQMANYAEVDRLANNRPENDYFEPFLAVATKEKSIDIEIVSFVSEDEDHTHFIKNELLIVQENIERIKQVKSGNLKPVRCGRCSYCVDTKVLTGTTHFTAFNLY